MNPYESPTTASENTAIGTGGGATRVLVCLLCLLATSLFAIMTLAAFLSAVGLMGDSNLFESIMFGAWGATGCVCTLVMGLGVLHKRRGWAVVGLFGLVVGTAVLFLVDLVA